MATYSDLFTGTGALSADWETAVGHISLTRVSDAAKPSGSSDTCLNRITTAAATFTADQEASVVIGAVGSSDFIGPAVRVDASGGTGYILHLDGAGSGDRGIRRITGSGTTVIGTINVSCTVADVVKLRVVGTTLSAWKNGVQVGSNVTDSTYATGQPGAYAHWQNSNVSTMASFQADDVGSGPTPTPAFGRYGVRSPSR